MNTNQDGIDTGGGAYVDGNVSTGGGDFVGRDKIGQLIAHVDQVIVQGDYVDHQTINNSVQVDGVQVLEALIAWLADQEGLDKRILQNPGAHTPPEHIARQIEEVQRAQQQASAQGMPLTSQAAYRLGMLAAYRRDYQAALDYFRQATSADAEFSDGYEAIAWILQGRALDDLRRRDYGAALEKLAEARAAAEKSDPLDPQALAQRGYIAVTQAQACEGQGDWDGREKYYREAARLFEGLLKLKPNDASAYNGLGNVQRYLGNVQAAIEAHRRALELAPTYTAAWNDLAIAYEAQMEADPKNAARWREQALEAWREVYHLAPDDPIFSAEAVMQIGQHIRRLEKQQNHTG
ncbi:MAG: tetratricopeptide repeat protein [Anaerolineales bacterium]|nr:tetratricopeptide repeat protein [Anaerolineales bacterium]